MKRWDEVKLQRQLKNMPDIKDNQSKEELYQKIQSRIQENQFVKPKKKIWYVPALASVAVFFILLLLIPSFFNEKDHTLGERSSNDAADSMALFEKQDDSYSGEMEVASNKEEENSSMNVYLGAVDPDLENQMKNRLYTLGVPEYSTLGEFVIPVTILAGENAYPNHYVELMESFSGEQIGLSFTAALPINTISEENEETIVVDFPKDRLQSLSSTQSLIYKWVLTESFGRRYDTIKLTSDGQEGVPWGQFGTITELDLREPNRGYYLYESSTRHQFLVKGNMVNPPEDFQAYEKIGLKETLELMKVGNDAFPYEATIPSNVTITKVEPNGDHVTITFAEGTHITDISTIEAILFTAKDFGFHTVQIEGVLEENVGPYNFNAAIKVPNFINFAQ